MSHDMRRLLETRSLTELQSTKAKQLGLRPLVFAEAVVRWGRGSQGSSF